MKTIELRITSFLGSYYFKGLTMFIIILGLA